MKYFILFFRKILETIISVKVWTIASILIITTCMVYNDKMDAGTFATMNGSIVSIVFALREGFKIRRIRVKEENSDEKIEDRDLML